MKRYTRPTLQILSPAPRIVERAGLLVLMGTEPITDDLVHPMREQRMRDIWAEGWPPAPEANRLEREG